MRELVATTFTNGGSIPAPFLNIFIKQIKVCKPFWHKVEVLLAAFLRKLHLCCRDLITAFVPARLRDISLCNNSARDINLRGSD